MLLGLSWSELSTLFFPTLGIWFIAAIILALIPESMTDSLLLGLLIFLLGFSITLSALAIWFRRVRRRKSVEGWHLHRIATGLHFTGWFAIIHRDGHWRV